MIRAIIIDDETIAIDTLAILLQNNCPEIEIVGTASNIRDGKNLLESTQPDLMFLDIQMPGGSGLDLVERITGKTSVVFTTAYGNHAIKAIRLSAFDFLLKPINYRELIECIERFKDQTQKTQNEFEVLKELLTDSSVRRISVATSEGYKILHIKDLICCEAARSYTIFHVVNDEPIISSRPIGEFESLLPSGNFRRVHRSFIVNLDHVTKIKKGRVFELVLSNSFEVELSKTRKEEILAILR